MSISEQVNKIHKVAKCVYLATDKAVADDISSTLNQAADTIEFLSAKLQAANMERSNSGEAVKLIEAMAEELDNCYGRTTELTDRAYEYINRSSEDCGGELRQAQELSVVKLSDLCIKGDKE